jgi:adenylate cyclase class IV
MVKQVNRLVSKFSEFETKYEVDEAHLEKFGTTLQESTRHFETIHVDGRDDFYIHNDGNFLRHRINNEEQELTLKRRLDGDLTHRLELNLNVGLTDEEVVAKFADTLGYKYSFTLFKESIIYHFADACLAFYKVKSKSHKKARCFVEIEVYNNIKGLDEKKAYRIIKKYEKVLHDIGVTEYDRLNSSLFELYKPVEGVLKATA